MRLISCLLFALVLFACQETAEVVVEKATIDDQEYLITEIPGSATKRAVKQDELGNVTEAGYLLNGLKQGTWTNYGNESAAPEKIVSYIDGALNGPYIEMDQQGRYALLANYKNNILHGPWVKYRIGRPEQTANYIDGQLDGTLAEFDFRNGKIKQEVNYKMGVQHGPLRYFNEEGKVTLEYIYEDGERVSGGIVE